MSESVAVAFPTGGVSLQQVLDFQAAMTGYLESIGQGHEFGQTEHVAPVINHFCGGVYAREMHLPAGACLVGKMHRFDHLVTLAKGRIMVATEEGVETIEAPATFVGKAGTKRIGLALEDVVWINYHQHPSTNVEDIERDLIVPESQVLEFKREMEAIQCHGAQ